MKKILVYIFVGLFSISVVGSAAAVEKKTKPKKQQTVQKKDTTVKKTDVKKAPAKNPTQIKKAPKKKYDTFVDKNNNGIDDRKENLKSTSKAPKVKKKTEKKK